MLYFKQFLTLYYTNNLHIFITYIYFKYNYYYYRNNYYIYYNIKY